MPETPYDDSLELVRAEMHAFERGDVWRADNRASEQRFEAVARQRVDELQRAAKRAGHDHIRYQYDQFGHISGVFDEDCAACWRDHQRDVEREAARVAEQRAEQRRLWRIGAALAVLLVASYIFAAGPPA